MDNLSTDKTESILHEYQKNGLVHYLRQKNDDYEQGVWVTEMARMAFVNYGAKWVINNDADEFWWPLRHNSLREALLNLSNEFMIVEARRHNFIPIMEYSGLFYESMVYREINSLNPLGNPLPPKVCHRGLENVVVEQGNHMVKGFEDGEVCRELIEILHFPFRNLKQYQNKIIKGGQAYLRNTRLSPEVGITWRRLYEHYLNYGRLPDQNIAQIRTIEQVMEGLNNGNLVEDRRLVDYMLIQTGADNPS
jgi:hypothetical protein